MPTDDPRYNPSSYTNNNDGTITDNVTELMWQRDGSSGTFSWQDAKSYCVSQATGGYTDWRLPTQIELMSIIDYTTAGGIPYAPVFNALSGAAYWTSTPTFTSLDGWVFDSSGQGATGSGLGYGINARCVR